jgi:hypothetical protein
MSTVLPSVVMSKPVDFEVLHEPGELPEAPVEARR